jgi:hypothetical protein
MTLTPCGFRTIVRDIRWTKVCNWNELVGVPRSLVVPCPFALGTVLHLGRHFLLSRNFRGPPLRLVLASTWSTGNKNIDSSCSLTIVGVAEFLAPAVLVVPMVSESMPPRAVRRAQPREGAVIGPGFLPVEIRHEECSFGNHMRLEKLHGRFN